MKKNLLFAGLILAAAPLFAQDGPVRTAQDAKVMFEQNFEMDWQEWLDTEIDRITEITYYKNTNDDGTLANTKIWEEKTDKWEPSVIRTDSVLILKNGVMTTDAANEIEGFKADQYTIVNDEGNNIERQKALDKYGVDGGTHYFRYVTDTVGIATSDYGAYHTDHTTANYRRNLFIRGLNIEDESSYRLTFYVKAENYSTGSVKTTMYADVMRGYFHSEKPFSMGLEDDANNYKYNKTFEYKKEAFTGDWEKVTFMTYYLNDSIADRFVFINGYWWNSDWTWTVPQEGGDTLRYRYVKQPDKYFVRLSFASDSTRFSVDNISLTKSWIGGVEHYKDMLRVDFGYETNMNQLAKDAKKTTNIAAVELPGEYFQVWGYYHDEDNPQYDGWDLIDIASAEYHDDGYMYMWTTPDEYGDVLFDDYDTVLVSFTNPVDDPSLCLKYTGTLFPKALDVDWIKAGKLHPGFSNELSYENPNIGIGVYSMKNLPPVCQGAQYEFGSFNLDGNIREMTFYFSREIAFDYLGEASENALLYVSNAGGREIWAVKSADDKSATFVRPSAYTTPLEGDYEFKIIQLRGANTAYGDDVVTNYSFGKAVYDPTAPGFSVDFSGWDTESSFKSSRDMNGFTTDRCATKVAEWEGQYSKALMFGLYGVNTNANNNEAECAKLFYTFDWAADAPFELQMLMSGCNKGSYNDGCRMLALLYNEAGEEIARVDIGGFGNKPNEGAETEFDVVNLSYTVNDELVDLPAGTYKLALLLPNEGAYGGSHKGGLVLYYMQAGAAGGSIATPYLSAFAAAQKKLADKIAAAEADFSNYGGETYKAGVKVLAAYEDFNVTELVTAPSEWNAATAALNAATGEMNSRFGIVDKMWAAFNASMDKIAEFDGLAEADGVAYSNFDSYQAMMANCEKYEDLVCQNETDSALQAIQAIFEADVKAIDAQKASYDKFEKALGDAKAAVEDSLAQKGFDEYVALETVYNQYKYWEATKATTADMDAATAALNAAASNYSVITSSAAVNQAYYKALAALATEVGADLGANAEEYAERAQTAAFDEPLAKVYKSAIKAAIYNKVANGEAVDSIPLSALIKNNELYASVKVVERMDKQMPANGNDLKVADPNGANIQHTRHQYNDNGNMPIWVMILENDYTDLYQGWTARAFQTGNAMVTASLNEAYNEFSSGKSFWNGEIGMDWNSKATLAQELEDLPVGLFSIGANLIKNSGTGTKFDVINAEGATIKSAAIAQNVAGNQGVDSVMIENGAAKIVMTLTSGSGWSRADNFYLVFRGAKEDFDYAAAAKEAAAQVEELITFVDAAEAADQVEYIGLDGIKAQAPKAGAVTIKVTKNANGKNVIEKVLVK